MKPQAKGLLLLLAVLCGTAPGFAQTPELVVQTGHGASVVALAVRPDGRIMASAEYYTRRLKLWDLRTAKELRTVRGRADFSSLSFSPDGAVLAAATALSTVSLLDPETGTERLLLQGPVFGEAGIINASASVAFSPAGLLAGGVPILKSDGNVEEVIRLWLQDGTALDTLRRTETDGSDVSVVTALAFSPDGRTLAAGRENGAFEIWDITRRKPLWISEGSGSFSTPVADLAFDADGRRLLVVRGHQVFVIDVEAGAVRGVLSDGETPLHCVAIIAAESTVIAGGEDGRLRRWDLATGRLLDEVEVAASRIHGLVAAPGQAAYLVAAGNLVHVWDGESGRVLHTLGAPAEAPADVMISGDGRLVVTASEGGVYVWDARTGAFRGEVAAVRNAARVELARANDGDHLAVYWEHAGDQRSFLSLVRLSSLQTLWTAALGAVRAESPRVSAAGEVVAVTVDREWAWIYDGLDGSRLNVLPLAGEQAVGATGDAPEEVYAIDFIRTPSGYAILSTGKERPGASESQYRIDVAANEQMGRARLLGFNAHGPVARLAFHPQERYLAFSYPEGFYVHVLDLHASTLRTWEDNARVMTFSPVAPLLAAGDGAGAIKIWNVDTGKQQAVFNSGLALVYQLAFTNDGKHLMSATQDGGVRLWDVDRQRLVATFFFKDRSTLIVTPENDYAGSKEVYDAVAFRLEGRAYPFEQFDLAYNRPDRVLAALGHTDETLIEAYRLAYERRLRKLGFTEAMFGDDFHLPEVQVDHEALPLSTQERTLSLHLRASDGRYTLDRLNVFINDVPLYGSAGIDLRHRQAQRIDTTLTLTLSSGLNKIQVSAHNTRGAESLKETIEITYDGPADKPDLYFVAVGVADYADERYDLTYAAKDARDLVRLFAQRGDLFGTIHIDTLLDAHATREHILALRERLLRTKVDDYVVVFFAGHGLLDDSLNYYFGTHDLDFDDPATLGLAYAEIEGLLDGIPARQKLLLMDTCHAGEIDAEDVAYDTTAAASDSIAVRMFRGVKVPGEGRLRLSSTVGLMQELFADLRRGSGATVIAAAGGAEYALEAGRWQNGVFTFAVRSALEQMQADADDDGRVRVSELRDYVATRVEALTGGRQRPVTRRENLATDFVVR